MSSSEFRMGRLDHVHIRVPNRAEVAAADGIEPVRYWPAELHAEWPGRRT